MDSSHDVLLPLQGDVMAQGNRIYCCIAVVGISMKQVHACRPSNINKELDNDMFGHIHLSQEGQDTVHAWHAVQLGVVQGWCPGR